LSSPHGHPVKENPGCDAAFLTSGQAIRRLRISWKRRILRAEWPRLLGRGFTDGRSSVANHLGFRAYPTQASSSDPNASAASPAYQPKFVIDDQRDNVAEVLWIPDPLPQVLLMPQR
jgi:hypothetical protein